MMNLSIRGAGQGLMARLSNTASAPVSEKITQVRPKRGWISIDWQELWHFRELFITLTVRDLQVRYKQTIVGAAWAIIQPVLTMLVFSVFFGRLAKIPTDGDLPYPIFSYAALVPWQFFAGSLTFSANSIISNANMITKIYFPRIIVPVSSALSHLVDFGLAFVVFLLMMPLFGVLPTGKVIFLPFFLLLLLLTALGMGFWLSALNVKFRDVRYVIPFLVQFLLFVSPVVYPTSLIENEGFRVFYSLNPLVAVVNGFRWALLDTDALSAAGVALGTATALLLFVSGLWYFNQMERSFADVV